MISISVFLSLKIIHLFCLTSETHHDQRQIEIWSIWPPLKGKRHMIFLSLLGRGFLMNTRFQFNDVLWIELKTWEEKLCHIKDSRVVSCCYAVRLGSKLICSAHCLYHCTWKNVVWSLTSIGLSLDEGHLLLISAELFVTKISFLENSEVLLFPL